MRKLLLGIHRPPTSHNIFTTLHPRLPWAYVIPSHEQAHMKFHPNVRDRIEEHYLDLPPICVMSAYIPDVDCLHHRHILEKSFVASNMRSKYLSVPSSHKIREGLSLQLVKYLWRISARKYWWYIVIDESLNKCNWMFQWMSLNIPVLKFYLLYRKF